VAQLVRGEAVEPGAFRFFSVDSLTIHSGGNPPRLFASLIDASRISSRSASSF
jgi:hypothetical protein